MSSSSLVTTYGLPMGSYNSQIDVSTGGWTGSVTNDEITANGSSYIGGYVDRLFDLEQDWKIKLFYTDNSGSQVSKAWGLWTAVVTQDTSITAGNNPTIFQDQQHTSNPAPNLTPSNVATKWLTTSYASTIGIASVSDNNSDGHSGSGARLTVDASGSTTHGRGYAGNYNRYGVLAEYDRSGNTITITPQATTSGFETSDTSNTRGALTFTNVPTTGRFMIAFGHDANASDRVSGTFSSSDNTKFGNYQSGSVTATGSFESNAITVASTSSMGAVITYEDFSGTNSLNTDIILKLSANNGSAYSTATLTALPDFATGIKMAKVNDLSVTTGTQLKYKIEFANQSLGSKEARIRGVSLLRIKKYDINKSKRSRNNRYINRPTTNKV